MLRLSLELTDGRTITKIVDDSSFRDDEWEEDLDNAVAHIASKKGLDIASYDWEMFDEDTMNGTEFD